MNNKRCCFIVSDRELSPRYREEAEKLLLGCLFYLTFSKEVKEYYFVYDENILSPANGVLEDVRVRDPQVKRVLVCPEGSRLLQSFSYAASNRFEEVKEVAPEVFFNRAALYDCLLSQCDYAVFSCFEGDEEELLAMQRAKEQRKRVIDLWKEGTLSEWFKR